MTKEEIIKYWLESSNSDFNTMNNMFNSKDYHWSLFIGHLVIEKLLKAVCIYKTESEIPPRTHDLLYLAEKSGIETTDA